MEGESSSWVGRAKFSHSLVRSSSGREPEIPYESSSNPYSRSKLQNPNQQSQSQLKQKSLLKESSVPPIPVASQPKARVSKSELELKNSIAHFKQASIGDSKLLWHSRRFSLEAPNSKKVSDPRSSKSAKFSFNQNRAPNSVASSSSNSNSQIINSNSQRASSSSSSSFSFIDPRSTKSASSPSKLKPMRRSISPLPTSMVSEIFKEARSSSKRFSTPPPSRKASVSKAKRDSGRVAALEIMLEKWTVNMSRLYLGHRFASGLYSKLYHGIYKEKPVAVKIIRQPDEEENEDMAVRIEKQFMRELTNLSHLYHPNVIKLVGAWKKPPVYCIITEYLSGGSLRSFLHKQENRSLPLERVISIALQVARGMEYIHSQGVIHRDLKPENILFDQDNCVKIVDFGISCEAAYCDVLDEDPGTYRWMAPEMIRHKKYGHKVDVYSFGLLLWEMISGKPPYDDKTPVQAAFAVLDKNLRPPIPENCTPPVRALIEQCWSSVPEKRPDFWQVVKLLEQFDAVLAREGCLNGLPNSACQDHKKWMKNWIQRLKPSVHADPPVPKRPSFLKHYEQCQDYSVKSQN